MPNLKNLQVLNNNMGIIFIVERLLRKNVKKTRLIGSFLIKLCKFLIGYMNILKANME